MTTYTTRGGIRGGCGHKHRSVVTAYRCLCEDSDGCARHGGYSDRMVTRLDGQPLNDVEREELDAAQDEMLSHG